MTLMSSQYHSNTFPSSPNPRHQRLSVLLLVIKLFFVSVVTMLPIYVFLLASSSNHPLTKMNNSNSGQILFIVVVCHKYSFSFLFLLRHSFYSSDHVSPYGIPSSYHMHMYSSLPSYVPIISLSSWLVFPFLICSSLFPCILDMSSLLPISTCYIPMYLRIVFSSQLVTPSLCCLQWMLASIHLFWEVKPPGVSLSLTDLV